MRISSCSIRRYTVGKLPNNEALLAEAIGKVNRNNAGIDEYDEYSLYQILEDVDDELYFDGPEFEEGMNLELDEDKTITLQSLIERGANVKSLASIDLTLFQNHCYCCTDQQGDGETYHLDISERAEQLINEASQAISGGNTSKSLASKLTILTKRWSTPWEELTMLVGITTQDEHEPDFTDHWGDGSYSMYTNSEEAAIYQSTSDGWKKMEESQILSLLEASGISTAEWAEEASQRNIDEFYTAVQAGGYGHGLIPFIQGKLRDHKLTSEETIRIKSQSSYEPEMTACFAHALSYEPINIDLPAGCKYFMQAYSHRDGGTIPKPLTEQYLRENINIRIAGINYRDESERLQQYKLSYDPKDCMINFSITLNEQNGGCMIELKNLIVSVPPIESLDWEELQEKSFAEIVQDNSYRSSLQKWEELRDAAARGGCVDIVGIEVTQQIEFSWLKEL